MPVVPLRARSNVGVTSFLAAHRQREEKEKKKKKKKRKTKRKEIISAVV